MKVLFVCMADSPHAQSWAEMFSNPIVDVRIFANMVFERGQYNPIKWVKEGYTLFEPSTDRGIKVRFLLPNWKFIRPLTNRLNWYFTLNQRFLYWTILQWKPDIVHSLSLNPSGVFAWQAIKRIKKEERPLFLLSSWGSDIYRNKDIPEEREVLKELLANCDGFIADCNRDIKNALSLGLCKERVAFNYAIPVTGGIDANDLSDLSKAEKRDVILIPKAYEGFANKILSVIEALNMTKDLLKKFEVHLLMCDFDTEWYLSKMPEDLRKICHCHKQIPKKEVLKLAKRARIMIIPSVSDGTPSSLLEAMALGVLPIASPLESIKEWIVDQENGLLVNAVNPNQISEAIKKAIKDDDFFYKAQVINQKIIREKANRQNIGTNVTKYYEKIVNGRNKRTL